MDANASPNKAASIILLRSGRYPPRRDRIPDERRPPQILEIYDFVETITRRRFSFLIDI
jgi:hypothetical protein